MYTHKPWLPVFRRVSIYMVLVFATPVCIFENRNSHIILGTINNSLLFVLFCGHCVLFELRNFMT